jgi:hypothetical protein
MNPLSRRAKGCEGESGKHYHGGPRNGTEGLTVWNVAKNGEGS